MPKKDSNNKDKGQSQNHLRSAHFISGSSNIIYLLDNLIFVLVNLLLHLGELVNLLVHLSHAVGLLLLHSSHSGVSLDMRLLQVSPQFHHLRVPLLVELYLGGSGATGLVQSVIDVIQLL